MSAHQIPIFDGPETVNLHQYRQEPDFRVRNEGNLWLLFPDTQAAQAWRDEFLPERGIEWCGGRVIEARYIEPIVRGIIDAGLVVRGE